MQEYFNFFYSKNLGCFRKGIAIRAGRNFTGRICVQHQGGGAKYNYIKIDRYRNVNLYGTVFRIIQNVWTTGYIGLIIYENGLISFILLAEGVTKGCIIFSGVSNKYSQGLTKGNTQLLIYTKLFEPIHSVEITPGGGAVLIRAAGCYGYISAREKFSASLKLISGWHIILSSQVLVTMGRVSNVGHSSVIWKKLV